MDKGVVLQVRENQHLIVFTSSGEFVKAHYQPCRVGQEVVFSRYYHKRFLLLNGWYPSWKKQVAIAAVVILFLGFIFPSGNKNIAYAYVSIDMIPSIEVKIDHNRQVESITSYNKSGEQVVSGLINWKDKDIHQIVEDVMKEAKELGYLPPNQITPVLMTTTYETNGDNAIPESFRSSFEKEIALISQELTEDGIRFYHVETPRTLWEEAKKEGVSAGKYALLVHSAKSNNEDLWRADEWKETPLSIIEQNKGRMETLDTQITDREWKNQIKFLKTVPPQLKEPTIDENQSTQEKPPLDKSISDEKETKREEKPIPKENKGQEKKETPVKRPDEVIPHKPKQVDEYLPPSPSHKENKGQKEKEKKEPKDKNNNEKSVPLKKELKSG